jgi:hypothetical protein
MQRCAKAEQRSKTKHVQKEATIGGTDGSRCGKITRRAGRPVLRSALFSYFFLTNGVAMP